MFEALHLMSVVKLIRATEHAGKLGSLRGFRCTRLISQSVMCKKDASSRPSLDDVERISKGNAAKARGTGSRRIPHRLNAEERQQYEIAKQKVQGMLPCNLVEYAKQMSNSANCRLCRP